MYICVYHVSPLTAAVWGSERKERNLCLGKETMLLQLATHPSLLLTLHTL